MSRELCCTEVGLMAADDVSDFGVLEATQRGVFFFFLSSISF